MRLTFAWVLRTLEKRPEKRLAKCWGSDTYPFTIQQDEFRAALHSFLNPIITTAILPLVDRIVDLEKSVKRLQQFHCDHKFACESEGCLESIFCSLCGALSPDWEECSSYAWSDDNRCYINEDGSRYAPALTIKDQDYRKKEE